MIKKVFGRKLSRSRSARGALFTSLIRSLLISEKIITTKAKAKAIRGQMTRYLHLVKEGSLEARRRILADLDNDGVAVKSLFSKKFLALKVVNLPARKGDNAPMVRIELSKNENVPAKTKRSK